MFLKTFGITALIFTVFIFLGVLNFEFNINTETIQLDIGSFWIGIICAFILATVIRLVVAFGQFLDKKTKK